MITMKGYVSKKTVSQREDEKATHALVIELEESGDYVHLNEILPKEWLKFKAGDSVKLQLSKE